MHRHLLMLSAITALTGANAAHADPVQKLGKCYAPLDKILTDNGFAGGLDCANAQIKIKAVGRIVTKTGYVAVYDMVYRFKAAEVYHGGERIILIENGKAYLGQYGVFGPPLKGVAVRGNAIVNATDPEGRIVFQDGRPPQSVLIDGTPYGFGK